MSSAGAARGAPACAGAVLALLVFTPGARAASGGARTAEGGEHAAGATGCRAGPPGRECRIRRRAAARARSEAVPDGPVGVAPCAAADVPADALNAEAVTGAVRCLVDVARQEEGQATLRADEHLTTAARGHAEDMVARHYFSHDTPEGGHGIDRAVAAGYEPARFGEAIAAGTVPADTARRIVEAWLDSPPHRAILLAPPYRDAGVWVAPGTPNGLGGATFVFDLGDR